MRTGFWFTQSLIIALGGAFGAVARFWFSELTHVFFDRGFPMGTLLTNVLGSFLMGLLSVLLFERFVDAVYLRSLLLVGFLGAFTTFSTFSLDSVKMMNSGHWMAAGLNIILSVVLCVIAAGAGVYISTEVL